jgi:hypothetical protein
VLIFTFLIPLCTAFAITISLYAALRERVRFFMRKLFGREPLAERDVLSAFSDAASGQSRVLLSKVGVPEGLSGEIRVQNRASASAGD